MSAADTLLTAPPAPSRWRIWRDGLFGSPGNILITLLCAAFLAWTVPPLLRWTLIDATWTGTADACRANGGACWAFVGEKLRYILFGFYEPDRQWRPAGTLLLVLGFVAAACVPRFWSRGLIGAGVAVLAAGVLLMGGAGGPAVPTDRWGGLTLTVLLAFAGMTGAFPLAVLLALGRRSRMGLVRVFCVVVIEVVRGVPLIAVLYVATLLVPLMLPAGVGVDKLLRAQAAIILFISAYMAEIVRAGLQSVPHGQVEAAKALGLGYWATMRLVVLPQALRTVIPSLVTLGIGVVQDTTLIVVIGLFDVLNTARTSATDPNWVGFYDEAFAFAALIYLTVSIAASRYSLWLEARLARGR